MQVRRNVRPRINIGWLLPPLPHRMAGYVARRGTHATHATHATPHTPHTPHHTHHIATVK
eukprot:350454-Chlamydomonas_euryale.AAC.9